MDWGAIIIAGLGGGFFVAIVQAVANKDKVKAESKKIQADVVSTLAVHYADELTILRDKVIALEGKVDSLKCEIENREGTIEKLKLENEELTLQVDKLTKALARKDAKVLELQKQVAELTARLDAMNGCGDGD